MTRWLAYGTTVTARPKAAHARHLYQICPYTPNGEAIGFVNADRGGQTSIALLGRRMLRGHVPLFCAQVPAWTHSGGLLLSTGYTRKLVRVSQSGQVRESSRHLSRAAPLPQGHLVAMVTEYGDGGSQIALYDPDAEEVVETLMVTGPDYVSIGTHALSGSRLIYLRWRPIEGKTEQIDNEIFLLDLEGGREQELVHRQGVYPEHRPVYPAISPDGEWVAYVAIDGIYLIRADGSDNHSVVAMGVPYFEELDTYGGNRPPAPCWSPDSRSLVYHRCLLPGRQECTQPEQYAIFRLDLETGEETLLMEGGIYPYWRLTPGEEAIVPATRS